MIEALAFIALGLLLGTVTGLFPGLHLNTAASVLVWLGFPHQLETALLIVAMNVMHGFLDFIPSILVGAPSENNFLSVLPGHQLFLEGNAWHAIQLSAIGNLLGTIAGITLFPWYMVFAQSTHAFLMHWIPGVLLLFVGVQIFQEKTAFKKTMAAGIALLAGLLGLVSLSHANQYLFPLITGLFGTSTLVASLKETPVPIEQKLEPLELQPKNWLQTAVIGSMAGAAVSLFPTLSGSHAAFLAQTVKRFSNRSFLVLLGAINSAATLFSFGALLALEKTRTGSMAAMQALYPVSGAENGFVLATVLFCAGISAIATLFWGKKAIQWIARIPYAHLTKGILALLVALAFVFSGTTGLIVLAAATAIGALAQFKQVKKTHCMGCLVFPTVLFYLSF